METDGFQADTEDEDDDDCIILCPQSGKCKPSTTVIFLLSLRAVSTWNNR